MYGLSGTHLYVHVYLLIIAVNLHSVIIFILFTFMSITLQLHQRLNVSVMCVLPLGLWVHYSSSAVEHVCAMWEPYLFNDICQICVPS